MTSNMRVIAVLVVLAGTTLVILKSRSTKVQTYSHATIPNEKSKTNQQLQIAIKKINTLRWEVKKSKSYQKKPWEGGKALAGPKVEILKFARNTSYGHTYCFNPFYGSNSDTYIVTFRKKILVFKNDSIYQIVDPRIVNLLKNPKMQGGFMCAANDRVNRNWYISSKKSVAILTAGKSKAQIISKPISKRQKSLEIAAIYASERGFYLISNGYGYGIVLGYKDNKWTDFTLGQPLSAYYWIETIYRRNHFSYFFTAKVKRTRANPTPKKDLYRLSKYSLQKFRPRDDYESVMRSVSSGYLWVGHAGGSLILKRNGHFLREIDCRLPLAAVQPESSSLAKVLMLGR